MKNPYAIIGADVEHVGAGRRKANAEGTATAGTNNTSAILNSISSLVDSLGGLFGRKNTTTTSTTTDPVTKVSNNNTAVYVMGGVLLLLILAVIFWLIKKKK